MQIQVRYNEEKEGIELVFPDKPEEEVLERLRELGFRWHRRKRLWYAKQNPERKAWAESISGTEMAVPEEGPLVPSFEPSLEQIERRNFAFVYINFDNLDGRATFEPYVMFEPSVAKGRKIAEKFGRRRHGANFSSAQIFPRKHKVDCRKLFAAGRIIRAEDLEDPKPEATAEPRQMVPKASEKPIWWEIHQSLLELIPDLEDRLKQSQSSGISTPEGQSPLEFEFNEGKGESMITLSLGKPSEPGFIKIEVHIDLNWARGLRYQDGLGHKITADTSEGNRKLNEFLETWLQTLLRDGHKIEDRKEAIVVKPKGLNEEIEAFIREKDQLGTEYLAADKAFLRRYTGKGGKSKEGMSDRGVLYEFYTPEEITKRMWGLALKHGYKGGPVLEPACGTGIFIEHAPDPAQVSAYETNPISARIAQILNPEAQVQTRAFETRFFAGNIHLGNDFGGPEFELVIGNPPYGAFTGRWAGMGEKRHTKATRYEEYFILRSLDLLLPGGLLVFIVPSSFMRGADSETKRRIAERIHEPLAAYRLANAIFPSTDIGTDIIVLKRNTK